MIIALHTNVLREQINEQVDTGYYCLPNLSKEFSR